MNRSELETQSRKQLLALATQAGVSNPRALAQAALIEALLTPPPVPAPESMDLPSSYGRTRLTLVEIEPHWVHAYWEITTEDCARAAEHCGTATEHAVWVLRFHDVTGVEFNGANAHDTFDVPVDFSAGNWYINLWAGGKSYCAEMGLRAADGVFRAVSRSGVVHVPVDSPSSRSETEWMKVDAASGRAELASEPAAPPAAPPPLIVETPVSADGSVVAPAEVVVEVTATEVALPVAVVAPESSALPTVSPPPAGSPTGINDADLRYAQLLEPPGPNGDGNGHAPAETPVPAAQDGSPAGQSGAVQEVSPSSHSVGRFGMSSGAFGADGTTPSIKLELNADLIIYGRAAPGQTVEVCGRQVRVNADGTFNVRMALPLADGDVARGG